MVPETTEFDDIATRIASRNERVPLDELQETDQHHDLSWLVRSLNIPFEKLEHFVLAHRLANFRVVPHSSTLLLNTLLTNDPQSFKPPAHRRQYRPEGLFMTLC
jgi:hypothetical protein